MEKILIQQRLALGRERVFAIAAMVIGGVGMALVVVTLVTGSAETWFPWIQAAAWLLIGAGGVWSMRRYRRRMAAFEAEHGPDAGKQ
jgi:ABC-type nickel/cobalt efflux system permease component RcnA